ncbi:hypothetical protein RB653_008400 [Dictyostelium firmibasis]|uniref:Proteasome assembly chaperone 4 n=1 Tax=Dictyostelium firmibasis TaxID=79012 RepID=A0AAN7TYY1_9MYCE
MESLRITDDLDSIDPNIRIEKHIDNFEDTRIYFMFYIFKSQDAPIFIWVSDSPTFSTLSVSMKIPMEKLPITSHLLESSSINSNDSSNSLSQRIVIKFKVQTFLSYSISQDIPEMSHFIEKTIFDLLSKYLKK